MISRAVMHRSGVAGVLVLGALAWSASLRAQPAAPAPQTAGQAAAPTWKQIFQNSQTVFYVEARAQGAPSGDLDLRTLLDFKVPQVLGGSQVWSIVAHLKVSCGRKQMTTVDNTLYALRMGAGPVVAAQRANDAFHTPSPGSLCEAILREACAAP